ncbi:hypothetical protein [Paraburkholderia sp. DHOC27]|uniref:hypothetical protein n=1 Tax=Paraburkholderia sp. DHOC27 TaxID=2303330 RepID=UPI0011C1793C|nr:hypothetical protein [Paraburkholderia sp. DHOC27]
MTNRNQITVDYDEGAVQSSVTLQAQSKAGRAFHGIEADISAMFSSRIIRKHIERLWLSSHYWITRA